MTQTSRIYTLKICTAAWSYDKNISLNAIRGGVRLVLEATSHAHKLKYAWKAY